MKQYITEKQQINRIKYLSKQLGYNFYTSECVVLMEYFRAPINNILNNKNTFQKELELAIKGGF